MKAISIFPIIITISILFIIDLYTFRGVKMLTEGWGEMVQRVATYAHWLIFISFAIAVIIGYTDADGLSTPKNYKFYYFLFGSVLLFYMPKLVFAVFQIVDDVQLFAQWGYSKIKPVSEVANNAPRISRSKFLYETGIVVASLPFIGTAYGMLKGRFDFRVVNETLNFPNLPKSFDGLKVVQISDAHLGSFFNNYGPVEKAIEIINGLEADVVVFTGDLVNNFSEEAEKWIPYFKEIKAKRGKFSIVGNHDYGGYSEWKTEADKAANFQRLQDIHGEMGFRLLMNENEILEQNGESIALLGVENWGVPPFPQKGDLTQAKSGAEKQPFKILLSHDPSHWDAVVRKEHQDVDITLSGHTHGAQFGVELGNIKWSPVKYKYPRWAGLYREANQFLYVNRGFGYIGFPGRVGMPPEITCLTLKTVENA